MTVRSPVEYPRDALVAAVLFVIAAIVGSGYAQALRTSPGRPETTGFTQRVYGAALMRACGRGLTTPSQAILAGDPAAGFAPVREFLAMRLASISCAEVAGVPVEGLDGLQRASRYLLWSVAGAWLLGGPSWAAVDWLTGLLFALTIALAYLGCRAAMGKIAAAGAALLFLVSPLHLQNLADLRDYSKAPFFVAALCAIALVVTRPRRGAFVVGVACVTGAVLGFGFGMRTDVLVNVVLVCGAMLVFLPGRVADTWKVRIAATIGCAVCFGLVASPLLSSFETRSSPWHVALLGYAHDWDGPLNLTGTPYETGHFYSDSYVATLVDAYWGRTTQGDERVSVGLPHYGEASHDYYMATLTTFPADMAARAWASVITILQLPFSGTGAVDRRLLPSSLATGLTAVQRVLLWLEDVSVLLFVAVVLGISVHSARLAALVLGLAIVLGAYPAIQFQPRHIFHLEIVSLWSLAFAAAWMARAMVRVVRGGALIEGERSRRPAVFAAIIILAVVLPITGLRAYQQGRAHRLFMSYLDAEVTAITAPETALANGVVRLAAGGDVFARPRGGRSMYSELLVAEIDDRCGLSSVALTFRYAAEEPIADFSRAYEIDVPPGAATRVVFPVFETGGASPNPGLLSFAGLEVLQSERACISQLSRLTAPDRFDLLLPVVLPPGWRALPLYERLRRWEGDAAPGTRVSYWSPASLAFHRPIVLQRIAGAPAFAAPVEYQGTIATVAADGSITVDGLAESAASYVVAWRAAPFDASSVVVVEGRLERGGITVGLVDGTGWVSEVEIDAAGAFRAAVQAPAAGAYQLVIANHRHDGALKIHFDVSRIAVVSGGL